jgi:hypothetical protein
VTHSNKKWKIWDPREKSSFSEIKLHHFRNH